MTNVIQIEDLKKRRDDRIKVVKLEKNITELREINHYVGDAILGLTNYDKYSSVKRVLEDLFTLHQDIKRSISNKEDILERLKK
jgi:hypothetical protein